MLKHILTGGIAALALAACATQNSPQEDKLSTELVGISTLLVGDYFSHKDDGAREGRPIYLRIREIDPPADHSYALYSEMRHDGPNGEFYRQLIYLFDEAADRTENSMIAYGVSDPETAAKLTDDPQLLSQGAFTLKPPLAPGCVTSWSSLEMGYRGFLDPETCVITGRRGDKRRIESQMVITAEAISQLERGYTLERELLFGNADDELYVWPRVTPAD